MRQLISNQSDCHPACEMDFGTEVNQLHGSRHFLIPDLCLQTADTPAPLAVAVAVANAVKSHS